MKEKLYKLSAPIVMLAAAGGTGWLVAKLNPHVEYRVERQNPGALACAKDPKCQSGVAK